ncbi:MAG TPA: XRE family transcriptional regulator [Clostridia bacterium]|nr:XRE family transcriptional regulator [Clostridia bacterium]
MADKAIITPSVIQWARNLDSIPVKESARSANVTEEQILAWESGADLPTIRQAKLLANKYRVPYVYFFLPDIPKKIKRVDFVDFRTFHNKFEQTTLSRNMLWLLRDIYDRREVMLDMYEKQNRKPNVFSPNINARNATIIAKEIRSFLGIDYEKQRLFRKPEVAYNYYVSALEMKDVLVFQTKKIDRNEMRGLSVYYSMFPIIVLNRTDEPAARLFSLIHELAHLFLRTSGLCNDFESDVYEDRNKIELFCNQVAAMALVPLDIIKSHPIYQEIAKVGYQDTFIQSIARDFAVSREVILGRLLACDKISRDFYFRTLERFTEEYLDYKKNKKDGFVPPAIDNGSQVGKLYARTVLTSLGRDIISPIDASHYLLNLSTNHFRALEGWCF